MDRSQMSDDLWEQAEAHAREWFAWLGVEPTVQELHKITRATYAQWLSERVFKPQSR